MFKDYLEEHVCSIVIGSTTLVLSIGIVCFIMDIYLWFVGIFFVIAIPLMLLFFIMGLKDMAKNNKSWNDSHSIEYWEHINKNNAQH